jgi:hypothetical protein
MTTRYAANAIPRLRGAFALHRRVSKLLDNRRFDGGFIGVLAELVVENHFPGMVKARNGTAGYDFIDADGRRVQVKGWGSANRTHDKIADLDKIDRFIRIVIFDDGYEIAVDMLTAPYGTVGGLVVYKDGRARPLGSEHANPRSRAAGLKAQKTIQRRDSARRFQPTFEFA